MSEQQTTRKEPLWGVLLFMAGGIMAAGYLVMVKLKATYTVGHVAGCDVGGQYDCAAVQTSDHALVMGVPISIWAIATYFMLLVLGWMGMNNQAKDDDPAAPQRAVNAVNIVALIAAISTVYSVYLSYLQVSVIGARCLVCYGMYAAQLGVLICALMATPDSWIDAFKNGALSALRGATPVASAAGIWALALAAALIWYQKERTVQYHDGAATTFEKVKIHLADDEFDKAQLLLQGATTTFPDCKAEIDRLTAKVVKRQGNFKGGTPDAGAEESTRQIAAIKSAVQAQNWVEADRLLTDLVMVYPEYQRQALDTIGAIVGEHPTDPKAAALLAKASGAPVGAVQPKQPVAQPKQPVAQPKQPVAQPKQPVAQPKQPVAQPTAANGFGPFSAAGVKCSGKRGENGWSNCDIPFTDDDFVYGNPNAKITIHEFADFECGYCKMLSSNFGTVKEKYKDQIRFVFKFYPMDSPCNRRMGGEKMHPDGCTTAIASYCAGKQGKFWEAHDKLFAMQKANQPDKVRGYMEQLGLNMAAWDACITSPAPLQRINNDVTTAARAGIHGTPRMYINGRLVSGSGTPAILEYYIQNALKEQAAPARQNLDTNPNAPMVKFKTTGGEVYIDRYEAAIDQSGRAVSLPKVTPTQVSWFEATKACTAAGKRLCTEEEWTSACTGAPAVDNNKNGWFNDDDIEGTRYPYGAFHEPGNCHDGEKTLDGAPIATGSKSACKSVYGAFDMGGNIAEWVETDEKRASLAGGHFGSGEGAACRRAGSMFGPGIRNNTTGFRCCADTLVANKTTDPAQLQENSHGLIGAAIPPFRLEDSKGGTVDSASFKGKVTYVTFFASWCGSCKRELPELKNWQDEMSKDGFQVVAIGVDRATSQSKNFADKYEPNYTVAFDPESTTMTEFDISAMPTSFVVDKKGVVRKRVVGFKKEEVPGLKAFIKTLL